MIAIAVLAAQYAGTLDLLDTTQVQVRTPQPPTLVTVGNRPEEVVVAADAFTTATARLHVGNRRWDYTLSYSPSLTAPDLELEFDHQPQQTDPAFLQAVNATIAWHDRSTSVTVAQSGSLGRISTAIPYTSQAPAQTSGMGQTTPGMGQTAAGGVTTTGGGQTALFQAPKVIFFGSSNTNAIVGWHSRRTTLTLSGGYLLAGGITPEARQVIPEQFGPSAAATVAYALSRIDSVSASASAQQTTTSGQCAPPLPGAAVATTTNQSCREDAPVAQAQGLLRRSLSSVSGISVNVGVAASVVQGPSGKELVILPVAGAAFNSRLRGGRGRTLVLSTQLSPVVDFLTGLVSNRLQTNARLSEELSAVTTVSVTAGLLRSVPSSNPDNYPITSLSGTLQAHFHLNRNVDVIVGEQEIWEDQAGYPPLVTSLGYVSVTARAPTLHF